MSLVCIGPLGHCHGASVASDQEATWWKTQVRAEFGDEGLRAVWENSEYCVEWHKDKMRCSASAGFVSGSRLPRWPARRPALVLTLHRSRIALGAAAPVPKPEALQIS